jgi:hypothetical protein
MQSTTGNPRDSEGMPHVHRVNTRRKIPGLTGAKRRKSACARLILVLIFTLLSSSSGPIHMRILFLSVLLQ